MSQKRTPVVVFGQADFASLAHFYFSHDSDYEVVGFTVHDAYVKEREFEGLPVTAFEELTDAHSVDDVELFAPMSPSRANKNRQSVYEQGVALGWRFASYVSSRATVFDDLTVGANAFILEDNTIQPFVRIGANVVLWSGNHIGHHSRIYDHVFIASHVVVSGHCSIGANAYLGVNSTLRDGTTVGAGAVVGMGANVIRDVQEHTVNVGNPAKPTTGTPEDAT